MNREKKTKLLKIAQITLGVLVLVDLVAHYKAATHVQTLPTPVVLVKKPALNQVVDYITQTGNTAAFNSVNLVARIKGYLDDITFVDGSYVTKGSPLFIIEPEPYMAKVKEAKASIEALRAVDAYSQAEYIRQQRMYKQNATSLSNVEKWLAKSHESIAEIDKALASLDIAEINYSYTHIKAPFDGRIGRHLVDKGNLVGNAEATNLATIEQLDPIYVYFNISELDLLKFNQAARARGEKIDNKTINQVPVSVSLQNDMGYKFEGKLDFINTGLNASTGTMELRALLPNKDHKLVPNLFVQVRIPITKPAAHLTVPETAVLYDQIGSYLLTVDSHNMVVLKRVMLGSLEKGQRTVLKGLDEKDDVIVSGLQNANPGAQVAPTRDKGTA